MMPLFDLIKGCATRWEQMTLSIPPPTYKSFLEGLTGVPQLKALRLPQFEYDKSDSLFPLCEAPSLTHLDLSSNLLVSVPSGLSSLYNLISLNLSDNMIDSVLGGRKI